jgi:hypothetical protein
VLKVDGRLLLLDGGVGCARGGSAVAERAEVGERLCEDEGRGSARRRHGLARGLDARLPRPSLLVIRDHSTDAAMVSEGAAGA